MDKITETDLANMVNDKEPDTEALEYEEKIQMLTTERINLKVSPSLMDALLKMAAFNGKSVEDYCTDVLAAELQTNVGAATIKGPSVIGGATAKKVVGPTYSVTRVG